MKNEQANPILRKLKHLCRLSAVLILFGLSPHFSQIRAVNFVVTDNLLDIDILWNISPFDVGDMPPLPKFDLPKPINWRVISANFTSRGGGTSDVEINMRHIVAPHAGDNLQSDLAKFTFSFPYTQTPGISGSVPLTVKHPGIGHFDIYRLFWSYTSVTPASSRLVVSLGGLHKVPDVGSRVYNIFLLGLVFSASVFRRKLGTLPS